MDYRENGLSPPESVRAATNRYFQSQDLFSDWIHSRCEIGPDCWDLTSNLFGSWKAFAQESNELVGRAGELNEKLDSAGYQTGRDNAHGRYCNGIRVKQNNGWNGS